MGKSLVIVESPAKARTIAGYLGDGYVLGSSVGHIRDLPSKASDVPAADRKRFGALGVDVEEGFEPYYVVSPEKKKTISELKKHLADADELLLATDEDREGEAIAWHLVQVLKPKVPVRRMVFHEITKDAITRALAETRSIDERLVDAQETRRILDRLYGYEVSPVLWKKVTRGLSAGRVQSVATRLVVQRERERMAFRSAEYWDLLATFDPGAFEARLVSLEGARVAQGRDFEPTTGELRESGVVQLDEARARTLATSLTDSTFAVRSVDERPYRRKPAAPFRTATLQQEASRKLRFSAQTTMRVAQRLYEAGYITYMRTDSTTLSESAIAAARAQVAELFGEDFVPAKPRQYGRAVANAQEAHEAIRPAGDTFRTPKELAGELNRDELALYDLVWKRTLASQMEDARGQTVSLRIGATGANGEDVEFGASGTVITFRGFLAAYEPGKDEPTDDDEERVLPQLTVGQEITLVSLEPDEHATVPPARYTEPTLVRALEERGIGRPSTYAAILSTIVDRGYVFKKGTALVPTFVAFSVVNLLELHFEQLVDFDFTARMEDDLDRIAAGDQARDEWLAALLLRPRERSRAAPPRDRASGRDRCASRELDRDSGLGSRGEGRPLRAVPRTRRAASEPSRRPRARRAVAGARRGAPVPARQQAARNGSGCRHRDRGALGSLRAVCDRGAPRGSGREAPYGVALRIDVPRDRHARRRAQAALAPTGRGRARQRGGDRAERPLRAVHQEGIGVAVARERGAALHGHPRAGSGACSPSRRGAGAGARHVARSRNSARIRRAASPSSSATDASARTSRTARRTQACAGATRPRG